MATILSQQMGCTIKSDKYKSVEEFLKQLPGAEELAKEKALAERMQKEKCAQKHCQAYKNREQGKVLNDKNKKQSVVIKSFVETKISRKEPAGITTTTKTEISKERMLQADSLKNRKALQTIQMLSGTTMGGRHVKGRISVTLAHAANELSCYNLKTMIINQKEYTVSNWRNALEMFLLRGLFVNAADRVLRWKELGWMDWYQLVEDVEVVAGVRRKSQRIYLKDLSIIEVIEKLQWTFLMAGFQLDAIQVELAKIKVEVYPSSGNRTKKGEKSKQRSGNRTKKGKKSKQHSATTTTPLFAGWCTNLDFKERSPKRSKNVNSSGNSGFSYVVENGVVVRIGSSGGNRTIARSDSDSDDTWIGMGHFARDNGRFGSIDGVDYAD